MMERRTLLRRVVISGLLVCGLAFSSAANAALITTDAGYAGPLLYLGGQANGQYNFTFGPVTLPGMVFTRDPTTPSNSGRGGVLGQGSYGLSANGQFDRNPVYAGLDGGSGWMRFMLTGGPVSEFGAYLNYAPNAAYPNPLIRVLDASLNVIESYDLAASAPISTPGGLNQFQFRGIVRTTADIYGLELDNSYILATGTASGAPVPAVPEPASLTLLGLGLAGIARAVRRRRK